MTGSPRKLTAILAADVAGYSRLMGADEEGTLARLKAHRRELIDPAIAGHRGRIVKTTGDGMLAEFASVVDAVKCAVEIQKAMRERETDLPADQLIRFRIGVNLGDVIIDGDDIHGDGVNVAARLEALAEPGTICLSAAAWDQVRGKVSVSADDLGEKKLKNIERAIRVYRIAPEAAPPERSALPLPDKPSIAVLPFQNMSGDPEQEYFADGVVEEIITALSRLRWFFVIARNSSFSYKGKSPDVRQVGHELGVRYVLEGSVRKSGNSVRVTAQLVDATTGNHVWAERYHRELVDIFEVQDEITASVVGSIEPQLYIAESLRIRTQPPANLDAWGCVIRGLSHLRRLTADDARLAQEIFEQAVSLDPGYARAVALLAYARVRLAFFGWSGDVGSIVPEARETARKAVALDHDDPWAHFSLGLAEHLSGNLGDAIASFGRAIQINPNFAFAHGYLAMSLAGSGRPEEAIEEVDRALRLSPRDPNKHHFFHFYALAHSAAGRFKEAAEWASSAIQERPEYVLAYRTFVANCALAGDVERARSALTALRRIQPSLTLTWVRENMPASNVNRAILIDGLKLAGLQ